jgi:choice-of-anchor C domain-containing protein
LFVAAIAASLGLVIAFARMAFTRTANPRNSGFEATLADAPYVRLAPGAHLDGWSVSGGAVDLVGEYRQSAEGNQSLHLGQSGAIAQDLATVSGRKYQLRFALAGNPDGQHSIKRVQIWWDGKLLDTLTFDANTHSHEEMGWRYFNYPVTASSASTQLRFVSQGDEQWGPALDDISVTPD